MEKNSVLEIDFFCTRWCFQGSEISKITSRIFCGPELDFVLSGSPVRVLLHWLMFSTLNGFWSVSHLFYMRENPDLEVDARGNFDASSSYEAVDSLR